MSCRTITFTEPSGKLDKQAPRLIGLEEWYDEGSLSQGELVLLTGVENTVAICVCHVLLGSVHRGQSRAG